jgi:hypothetical protein
MAKVIAAQSILLVLLLGQQAAPSAHADPAPQAGQRCNMPSTLLKSGGQWLVCAGTQWAPLGEGVLSTSDVVMLMSPCSVPGSTAIGVPYGLDIAYLVVCDDQIGDGARVGNVPRWMTYHP